MRAGFLEKRWRVILAGILMIAVPLVCLALFVYLELTRSLEQEKLSENQVLARNIARQLGDKLQSDMALGNSYVSRQPLIQALESGDERALQSHLKNLIGLAEGIEEAVITSPKGISVAAFPPRPSLVGENFSSREWYKAVSSHWQPYISKYYIRASKHEPRLFSLAIPVKTEEGAVAGILVMEPKETYITEALGEVNAHIGRGLVYILDNNGTLIYHPEHVIDRIIAFSSVPIAGKVLAGQEGAEKIFDPLREETVLAAYSPVGISGWGVVAQWPLKDALRPVKRVITGLFLVTLIMIAIGGFLAYRAAELLLSIRAFGNMVKQERDKAQQYLDIAGVMLVDVGRDQRVVLINKMGCLILGYDEDAIIGRNWFDRFIPVNSRVREKEAFNRIMAGHAELTEYSERPVLTKDGEERLISWHNTILRDEEGNVLSILCSGSDITERKCADEKIRQQREELSQVSRLATIGEFATSIAHEINQPLTAILNNAQAAQRFLTAGQPDIEEVGNALDDIISDNKRADAVIRNLRSFLKRQELNKTRLDINAVIEDVVSLLHCEIADKGVTVNMELNPEMPHVSANSTEMQQVLMNLILNACDAMAALEPQRRRLSIMTLSSGNPDVLVSVRDSGPGLNQSDIERVFEPFYTTKREGVGIGLSISKSIIVDHGGRLWALNNPEGGATFNFSLPLYREEL